MTYHQEDEMLKCHHCGYVENFPKVCPECGSNRLMLKGVNDSLEDAEELAHLLKGILCYVNLIPYNPVKEKPFERSEHSATRAFSEKLNALGVNCTVRKEFGTDIDAACGQLRVKYVQKEKQ